MALRKLTVKVQGFSGILHLQQTIVLLWMLGGFKCNCNHSLTFVFSVTYVCICVILQSMNSLAVFVLFLSMSTKM